MFIKKLVIIYRRTIKFLCEYILEYEQYREKYLNINILEITFTLMENESQRHLI